MMHSRLTTWVRPVAIATIATSLMLAVLVIASEEIPAVMSWLKATFYHHWLGKSVLALGLFIVVSLAARLQRDTPRLATLILAEAVVVIAAVGAIAGYFLLHVLQLI